MSGQQVTKEDIITVEELMGLDNDQQAEVIADHYASISNIYEAVKNEDFQKYLDRNAHFKPPNISPFKVLKTIKKMNQNAATVPGDLPMKIISKFADDLSLPLTHIVNHGLQSGQYPNIWKN